MRSAVAGPERALDPVVFRTRRACMSTLVGVGEPKLRQRAGVAIGEPDGRIAAIALSRNLTAVTGNVRHFSRVPGLAVENWLA